MGWWRVKDPNSGGIDWSHQAQGAGGLVNALPGQESEEDALYNGDGPADIMGAALREVNKEYKEVWGREAKIEELQAVFNFCLGGIRVEREDDDPEESEESEEDGAGLRRHTADLCGRCGHSHAPNMPCHDGEMGFQRIGDDVAGPSES